MLYIFRLLYTHIKGFALHKGCKFLGRHIKLRIFHIVEDLFVKDAGGFIHIGFAVEHQGHIKTMAANQHLFASRRQSKRTYRITFFAMIFGLVGVFLLLVNGFLTQLCITYDTNDVCACAVSRQTKGRTLAEHLTVLSGRDYHAFVIL